MGLLGFSIVFVIIDFAIIFLLGEAELIIAFLWALGLLIVSIPLYPMVILATIFLGIIKLLEEVTLILAGKDTLKKAFLIIGTTILLCGLILEFISTF